MRHKVTRELSALHMEAMAAVRREAAAACHAAAATAEAAREAAAVDIARVSAAALEATREAVAVREAAVAREAAAAGGGDGDGAGGDLRRAGVQLTLHGASSVHRAGAARRRQAKAVAAHAAARFPGERPS